MSLDRPKNCTDCVEAQRLYLILLYSALDVSVKNA